MWFGRRENTSRRQVVTGGGVHEVVTVAEEVAEGFIFKH